MRPVEAIRDELVEAGLTVLTAGGSGRERGDLELEAGETIRRRYDELGPDEQEALRVHLAVPEDDSADEVGLRLLDLVRRRDRDAAADDTTAERGTGGPAPTS